MDALTFVRGGRPGPTAKAAAATAAALGQLSVSPLASPTPAAEESSGSGARGGGGGGGGSIGDEELQRKTEALLRTSMAFRAGAGNPLAAGPSEHPPQHQQRGRRSASSAGNDVRVSVTESTEF